MREPVTAYLGLGANLGDARAALALAMADIAGSEGLVLVARSALYRSAPVGCGGPDYINAVVAVHTVLTAPQLLQSLQRIEAAAGRERPYPNAPRTLDLDILLYGDSQIRSAHLTVPHPRMWQRAFVLVPLAQIAPHRVDAAALRAVSDQAIERVG